MAVTLDAVIGNGWKLYQKSLYSKVCASTRGNKDVDTLKQHYLRWYHELLLDVIYETGFPVQLRREAWGLYSRFFHAAEEGESQTSQLTPQNMLHMVYFDNRVHEQYAKLGEIKRYSFFRNTSLGPLFHGEKVEYGKIGDLDVIIVPSSDQLPSEDNVIQLLYKHEGK